VWKVGNEVGNAWASIEYKDLSKPKAAMMAILLGTDYDSLLSKIRNRVAPIAVAICVGSTPRHPKGRRGMIAIDCR